MEYIKIPNLYKVYDKFADSEEVYIMEKIHGTSTWLWMKTNYELRLHSGGESEAGFRKLFDVDELQKKIKQIMIEKGYELIKIHGKCYGEKQQKMSATYGDKLKFVAFDVFIDDKFLDVPMADKFIQNIGLEFVHYIKGPIVAENIESQAEADSVQAIRNGVGPGKLREGVVIRPINERLFDDGTRCIAKHKNHQFMEVLHKRPLIKKKLDGTCIDIIEQNHCTVANDWITEMRVVHVIDKMLHNKQEKKLDKSDLVQFLELLVNDVEAESHGEIEWTDILRKEMKTQGRIIYLNVLKKMMI